MPPNGTHHSQGADAPGGTTDGAPRLQQTAAAPSFRSQSECLPGGPVVLAAAPPAGVRRGPHVDTGGEGRDGAVAEEIGHGVVELRPGGDGPADSGDLAP